MTRQRKSCGHVSTCGHVQRSHSHGSRQFCLLTVNFFTGQFVKGGLSDSVNRWMAREMFHVNNPFGEQHIFMNEIVW